MQNGRQSVRERGDRVRYEGVQLVVQESVRSRSIETHLHQAQQAFHPTIRDLSRDFGRDEKPRETATVQIRDELGGHVGLDHAAEFAEETVGRAQVAKRERQKRRATGPAVGQRQRTGRAQSADAAHAAKVGRQRIRSDKMWRPAKIVVAGKQFRRGYFDQFK